MSRWPIALATPDGATVLLPIVDGSSGEQWFAFEVRDRADRIRRTVPVLSLDDLVDDAIEGRRMAEVERSVSLQRFVEVAALEAANRRDDDLWDHQRFARNGVVVDWRDDRLSITRNGKRVFDRRAPPAWHAPTYWLSSASVTCSNAAFLRAAYATANVVVIVVGYHGTDTCEEPGDRVHVIGT